MDVLTVNVKVRKSQGGGEVGDELGGSHFTHFPSSTHALAHDHDLLKVFCGTAKRRERRRTGNDRMRTRPR
jgi:hypothetical protein